MNPTRKLWTSLGVVFVLSFAALGWMGREIYVAARPDYTGRVTLVR